MYTVMTLMPAPASQAYAPASASLCRSKKRVFTTVRSIALTSANRMRVVHSHFSAPCGAAKRSTTPNAR